MAGEETVVAKAQARVIAVAEAASALRSRIETIDSELDRLTETLRSTAARLDVELGAVERDVSVLYEAAGMRVAGAVWAGAEPKAPAPDTPEAPAPQAATPGAPEAQEKPATDLEGARLTALNMALNGDSRETTSRYLVEHFGLAEPDDLVDEVYSAVES